MNTLLTFTDLRMDEYDIDFEDTRAFAIERYKDVVKAINDDLLSQEDCMAIAESRDFESIQNEIQSKRLDPELSSSSKLLINQLQPLPQTIHDLVQFFKHTVYPENPPMEPLWGLLYLNLKLSYDSPEKLKNTVHWLTMLRRKIELFNRCLESCKDSEINESRIAIVEALDPILSALADSIKFLRSAEKEPEMNRVLPNFEEQISTHIADLSGTVAHLSEVTKFLPANREWLRKNLVTQETAEAELEASTLFPMQMLPYPRNPNFYGREMELKKIDQALSRRTPGYNLLRTYTIYGRRGVGKTEIALNYAYMNPEKFDAIFWVCCETSLSLRQSYTNIAKAVNIPGAGMSGHDEENHLAVLRWLKQTRYRWLMIFDNAEKEHLLKTYWPLGASGAVLITSRVYRNFFKDDDRKGDTIKPFSLDQSIEFFCQFQDNNSRKPEQHAVLEESEAAAAKKFLQRLEGLPLAINLAAGLVQNEDIGGETVESTFGLFKKRSKQLPERYLGKRSVTYHALDTLWDMIFRWLPENAREFMKVLSFLSPDTTYIDLFLPRNQAILDGKLSFCKRDPEPLDNGRDALVDNHHSTHTDGDRINHITDETVLPTSMIITPNQALEDTLEILSKAQLIKRHERTLRVRHEVQEAINHPSLGDLQDSFDAAVRLVAEAFPKRRLGISLFKQWATCAKYIHDGVHLAMKFAEYNHPPAKPRLKGTEELVDLIGNCAWYLYEISSYDEALQIIKIGYTACKDKESLSYADLCNTDGVCYLEKNLLSACRETLEKSLRIREGKLLPDDIGIAASTHNLGNLETAAGNYDKAMQYFDRALEIRLAQGDTTANQLALLYLCIGRAHTLRRDFDKANQTFNIAERLSVQTLGEESHLMAHVHYAYGNVANRSSNWLSAKHHYSNALKIALATNPIHPITAAAYMSLGNVEYKLKHLERAKSHLEKAAAIAELRSPTRDDGTVARILYVLSRVMAENPLTAAVAEEMRLRAETARNTLIKAGESALVNASEQEGDLDLAEEAFLYDALVPIFFR